MPGGKWRVHPLNDRTPRVGASSHLVRNDTQTSSQLPDELVGGVRHIGVLAHYQDGFEHVVK